MTEHGLPADSDLRTLGRRRRAKRALVANYIHELSERHNRKAARRLDELETDNPIEQPQGG
jgi:hypothetical protein